MAEKSAEDIALVLIRMTMGVALIASNSGDAKRGYEMLADLRQTCMKERYALNIVPGLDVTHVQLMIATGGHRRRDRARACRERRNLLSTHNYSNCDVSTSRIVEALLARGTSADLNEAEAAVDRLAELLPRHMSALQDVSVLRLRALLAHARGDESGYRQFRDRYRETGRRPRLRRAHQVGRGDGVGHGRVRTTKTAIAALWPPRPDPAAATGARPAQHDPIMGGRNAPAPRRCVEGFVVLDERPGQCAMEDVACRHPQRLFQVLGGLGLDAGAGRCVLHQHILNRLGQHRIERTQHGGRQILAEPSDPARDARVCGACRPKTVSVCAPDARSSSERMVGSVSEWQ